MPNIFSTFIKDNFTHPHDKTLTDSNLNPKRIEFIDLAKGVCIILVVAFHAGLCSDLTFLQTLRMPLYFILSGLFYKDYGNFLVLIEKKINKLIVPLLFFGLLYMIVRAIISRELNLHYIFIPVYSPNIVNAPTWFLMCLFWINIIFCTVTIKIKDLKYQSIIVGIFSATGDLLFYHDKYLPLFLASALTAFPFFYMGYLLRKTPLLYSNKFDRYNLLVSLALTVPMFILCYVKQSFYIDFRINEICGSLFIIIPISLCMVVGILLMCKTIKWLPVISYIGRNSIIVLGLHWIILTYLCLPIYSLTGHFQNFLLAMIVCWLLIPIFKTYFAKLTAQKDLVKFSDKLGKWLSIPESNT